MNGRAAKEPRGGVSGIADEAKRPGLVRELMRKTMELPEYGDFGRGGRLRAHKSQMRPGLKQLVRRLSSPARKIEEAIERQTRISREHLTPELRLHLLTPDCPLYHQAGGELPDTFAEDPFWSIYWPGGQAMARYMLDEGSRIFEEVRRGGRGVKVLDVGAGCGAAAIAAKLAGAGDVLANDIDEVACVAAQMNARLNNVHIRTSSTNLIGLELPEPFDLVLIGDLLYDEPMARRLEAWLDQLAARGSRILLADPGRHGLTDELRRKLVPRRLYRLPENVRRENHGYDEAAVWKFCGPRR